MKRTFVGKDDIIDLLGICLVGGENIFLRPQAPAPSLAGHLVRRCRIALREAMTVREPGTLLADPEALGVWPETASAVRLRILASRELDEIFCQSPDVAEYDLLPEPKRLRAGLGSVFLAELKDRVRTGLDAPPDEPDGDLPLATGTPCRPSASAPHHPRCGTWPTRR
jgi:hypothetical protein